jgi:hypothetical protein
MTFQFGSNFDGLHECMPVDLFGSLRKRSEDSAHTNSATKTHAATHGDRVTDPDVPGSTGSNECDVRRMASTTHLGIVWLIR